MSRSSVPVLAALVMAGCGRGTPEQAHDSAWWTPIPAPDAVAWSGADTPTAIPEVNGAGLALIDVDGDGVLEILLALGGTLDAPESGSCAMFKLDSGAWVDVTRSVGLAVDGWATSATAFDLEGDGDSDVVITRIGDDVLLRNDGGRFTDITLESGFKSNGWGTGAAVGDVDGDGWSDVYIVNYLEWDFDAPLPRDVSFMGTDVLAGPRGLVPQGDRLFLNNHDGTFNDVTEFCGLSALAPGFGLNALITDLDGDGAQDILVGNDTTPNMLLTRALGAPFRLEDSALANGLATNADGSAQATMGLTVGDVNGDGRPDVFSTNFSSDTNTLHASDDDGWFADRTQAFGLGLPSRPLLGWTTVLLDGDVDGDEDLLVLNGHVYPTATLESMDSAWRQPVLLLERDGDRFAWRSSALEVWANTQAVHRAGVLGVINARTTGPSLVTAPRNAPVEVLAAAGTGPLRRSCIALHDDRPDIGNREGHGARVVINDGARTHHRWITTSSPFQGASAPQVHASVPADTPLQVRVDWPEGGSTDHVVPPSDGVVIVRRSTGASASP